jgi:hypothetical protein
MGREMIVNKLRMIHVGLIRNSNHSWGEGLQDVTLYSNTNENPINYLINIIERVNSFKTNAQS